MAYVVPQVLINQRLSEVSLNTIQNQNVLVIGPNYALYRYSNADEKAKTYIGRYDGSVVNDDENQPVAVDGVISYPVIPADSVPEAAYTKLFADDLVIGLFDEDHGFTKLDDKQAGADFDGRIKFDFALVGKRRGTEVISEIDSNDQVTLHYGDTVVVPDMGRDIYAGDVIRIDRCRRQAAALPVRDRPRVLKRWRRHLRLRSDRGHASGRDPRNGPLE